MRTLRQAGGRIVSLSYSNVEKHDSRATAGGGQQRIDYDGNVLEAGPIKLVNRAAALNHAAVHKARPDVMAAAHTHSQYGRAFATLGIPLPVTSQGGCAFHNDLALYNAFESIVLEGWEGEHIAQAIGGKKAAILQNHGLLTCGQSVEETVFWFVALERLCHTLLLARAAVGGREDEIVKVGDACILLETIIIRFSADSVCSSYTSLGQHSRGWFSAEPLFDSIALETNEAYLA